MTTEEKSACLNECIRRTEALYARCFALRDWLLYLDAPGLVPADMIQLVNRMKDSADKLKHRLVAVRDSEDE